MICNLIMPKQVPPQVVKINVGESLKKVKAAIRQSVWTEVLAVNPEERWTAAGGTLDTLKELHTSSLGDKQKKKWFKRSLAGEFKEIGFLQSQVQRLLRRLTILAALPTMVFESTKPFESCSRLMKHTCVQSSVLGHILVSIPVLFTLTHRSK